MSCVHSQCSYSKHGHDGATIMGQTTGQAIGLAFHLVGAGAQLFRQFMHGLIWQEPQFPHGCACTMRRGCGPVVQHHYCVQCQPSPCACHSCC